MQFLHTRASLTASIASRFHCRCQLIRPTERRNEQWNENWQEMTDTFEYAVAQGSITVKNISGHDVTGDVAVYYKNVDGEDLLGGTTFRTMITGGIRADASASAAAGHFDPENTAILFAEIIEPENTSATDG